MGHSTNIPYRGIYYLTSYRTGYLIEIPHYPTNEGYFKLISHTVLWDGGEVNILHHPIPFRPL